MSRQPCPLVPWPLWSQAEGLPAVIQALVGPQRLLHTCYSFQAGAPLGTRLGASVSS